VIENQQDNNDFNESLRVAFRENWEHARWEEKQRFIVLGGLLALFIAILPIAMMNSEVAKEVRFALFALETFIGIGACYAIFKYNAEFGNHIGSIQVIACKLNLNKSQSEKPMHMEKGYMALPLPLKKRAHKHFFTFVPIFFTSLSGGVSVFSFSIDWMKINIILGRAAGFICFVVIFYYLWNLSNKMMSEADIIKVSRIPDW
jgi:hypothetical protein